MRTICEVHRQIYRELKKEPEKNAKLLQLLEEAYDMAKKMNNKLRQYRHNYDADWWEKNRLSGDPITKKD